MVPKANTFMFEILAYLWIWVSYQYIKVENVFFLTVHDVCISERMPYIHLLQNDLVRQEIKDSDNNAHCSTEPMKGSNLLQQLLEVLTALD
jgi:hypothetical protein